jgi:uncharacterized protein related to proFAR isomerase
MWSPHVFRVAFVVDLDHREVDHDQSARLSNYEPVEPGTSLIVADRASGLTTWFTILAA